MRDMPKNGTVQSNLSRINVSRLEASFHSSQSSAYTHIRKQSFAHGMQRGGNISIKIDTTKEFAMDRDSEKDGSMSMVDGKESGMIRVSPLS